MKWEDCFIKGYISSDYGFMCFDVIKNVAFLVVWVSNKYSRCGPWFKLISGVLVCMCQTTNNF